MDPRELPLRVLLVGKGGREHALAWKLSQSPSVRHVYVYPGNGGTAVGLDKVSNLEYHVPDYPALVSLAQEMQIGLVVVGSDEDVVAGVEGFFRGSGIPCFAPSKKAAEIEGSKTFAKDFMKRHGIPTATYQNFDDVDRAKAYVRSVNYPVVIKASGLAAGKGVVLPHTKEEACQALDDIMVNARFDAAGSSIVIEELLEGEEISFLTFSDGITTKSLPPGQDHKRISEGNTGPNTGGMGVFAPAPFVSAQDITDIETTILQPTFVGLREEGRTFKGMLFTGIMMTSAGPKVLEYNVRFGDPETQSMMLLLAEDVDLASVLVACTQGALDSVALAVRPGFACNVVVASEGYPGAHETGKAIEICDNMPRGVQVFHAGTSLVDGRLETAGGRVVSVAAWGTTLEDAVDASYSGVDAIRFKGMYYRRDIARRWKSTAL